MAEVSGEKKDVWSEDRLKRRSYAAGWEKYLVERASATPNGLTIALDAPWGAGKSFFVDLWARDLQQRHPVVKFDAWKNDRVADPMVAFMAELLKEVQALKKREELRGSAAQAVEKKSKAVVKSMAKAMLPAAKVVGKAMLKKTLSVDWEEAVEAVTGGSDAHEVLEGALDAAKPLAEVGLEKFLTASLDDYLKRQQGVGAFQETLAELVAMLKEHTSLTAPMFVFIDEVDRCRPDFAIRLLEEIKHVFGVKGIVFVLSVNLDQLGKSVKALYGAEFDGRSYLQRFFDLALALPRPRNADYAQVLADRYAIGFEKPYTNPFDISMPKQGFSVTAFSDVATMFGLTLREQEHVAAVAAVAGSTLREPQHAHWLFYLSALRYKYAQMFAKLEVGIFDKSDVSEIMKSSLGSDATYIAYVRRAEGHSEWETGAVQLSALIGCYYSVAALNGDEIVKAMQAEVRDFRSSIISDVLSGTGRVISRRWSNPILRYVTAVAQCGVADPGP